MIDFLKSMDNAILIWINTTCSNPIFDVVMPFITNERNWLIPIFLFLLYLGGFSGKRGKITLAILIVAMGVTDWISAFILKPYFARIRPSHTMTDIIHLLVPKGGRWSLPSNHAANMVALATVVSYFYPKWKVGLFSLAGLIALSRVYVGVHFPGDVMAGALVGYSLAWSTLSCWVILKMRELKRGRTWVWYEYEPPKLFH